MAGPVAHVFRGLQCGFLKPVYVPDAETEALRDLERARTAAISEPAIEPQAVTLVVCPAVGSPR